MINKMIELNKVELEMISVSDKINTNDKQMTMSTEELKFNLCHIEKERERLLIEIKKMEEPFRETNNNLGAKLEKLIMKKKLVGVLKNLKNSINLQKDVNSKTLNTNWEVYYYNNIRDTVGYYRCGFEGHIRYPDDVEFCWKTATNIVNSNLSMSEKCEQIDKMCDTFIVDY